MDNNFKTSEINGVIQDPRGEIKYFSKPPKKVDNDEYFPEERAEPKKRSGVSLKGVSFFLKIIGCWLPLALVVFFIFILITKPTNILEKIYDFANSDISIPTYENIPVAEVKNNINNQLKKVGENIIIINESEFNSLAKDKLPQFKDLKVDIEPNLVKLIWILEDSNINKPLYGVIELKLENSKWIISKIGTQRIQVPEFLYKLITDSLLSVMKLQDSNIEDSLLYTILPLDKSLKINSIEIENEKLKLNINLNAGIF